jgi:phage terminase large subunit
MTKTADKEVTVEFRGAARELFKAQDPEVLLGGPAGTGKTLAALYKLHLTCLANEGVRALVVRKTHASLTSSTLVTFRKKVAVEALAMNYVRFFGGSASEPAAFQYMNGSTLVVGGLDKPTKLLSTDYDLILIDEAIETDPDDLDILITRLRNNKLKYQQMIMLTNPGAPNHHLKIRADTGRCRMLYSRHEDNPAYYQAGEWTDAGKNYLAILETLPTVRRQRFLLGQWVAAEGLIYEDFDPAVHLVENSWINGYPPAEWDRFISVDFGFSNPFCALWIAVDPDGRMYVYREIYQTKTIVEDHAKVMKRVIDQDTARPRYIICDHDAEDRATLERHLHYSTVPAKKDVKPGIEAVQTRLRKAADGRPRLFVCKKALVRPDGALRAARRPVCLEEEFPTYVWDQRSQPGTDNLREAPVKQDDHALDSLRYAVSQLDLQPKVKFRAFYG